MSRGQETIVIQCVCFAFFPSLCPKWMLVSTLALSCSSFKSAKSFASFDRHQDSQSLPSSDQVCSQNCWTFLHRHRTALLTHQSRLIRISALWVVESSSYFNSIHFAFSSVFTSLMTSAVKWYSKLFTIITAFYRFYDQFFVFLRWTFCLKLDAL